MAHVHLVRSQASFILYNKHGEIKSTAGQSPTLVLLAFCIGNEDGHAAATVKASWRPDVAIISHLSRATIYAFRNAVLVRAARRIALKRRDVLTAAFVAERRR